MNYIRILIITATCLIPWGVLNAQQMELLFQGGMGTYTMTDLRTLNTQVQETLPFDTRKTESFPMTIQFAFEFAVYHPEIQARREIRIQLNRKQADCKRLFRELLFRQCGHRVIPSGWLTVS